MAGPLTQKLPAGNVWDPTIEQLPKIIYDDLGRSVAPEYNHIPISVDASNPHAKISLTDLQTFVVSYSAGGAPSVREDIDTIKESGVVDVIGDGQGVTEKFSAIKERTDEVAEILSNKHLILPLINDETASRATFTIPIVDGDGDFVISTIEEGSAGNAYTCRCVESTQPNAVEYSAGNLMITINDEEPWTALELVKQMQVTYPELMGTFMFLYNQADADKALGEASLDYFTGGDDGVVLTATSEELNEAADARCQYGTPEAATDKASLTQTGTGWSIEFEAVEAGEAGNDIEIVILGGTSETFGIVVTDKSIEIQLETDADDIVQTTAAKVVSAIMDDEDVDYSADAAALVTAVLTGSGTAEVMSVENLDGGSDDGTVAPAGALRVDDDYLYVAIADADGSADMTVWKKIALSAFAD